VRCDAQPGTHSGRHPLGYRHLQPDWLAVQEGSRVRDGTSGSQGFRFHHSPDLHGANERASRYARTSAARYPKHRTTRRAPCLISQSSRWSRKASRGPGPGFWAFPARHYASGCPTHRPKRQCRCLRYPSCGDDAEGTAWIWGRRGPQLAGVAVLQQRAAQPGARHLLDVLRVSVPNFSATSRDIPDLQVVMERIVAERNTSAAATFSVGIGLQS